MENAAQPKTVLPRRLNVGCGRRSLAGWINLDSSALPGVDLVADLERCAVETLPLSADSVDEFLLSHVLEHIRQPLPLMQELWRIATPGARMTVRAPYGASDDAFEDPTHVRQLYPGSFGYFSQPFYHRADYGYRGDWQPQQVTLLVRQAGNEGASLQEIMRRITTLRNVVEEMVVELSCIKPAREPRLELQAAPELTIQLI